jgi:hypothetical protein
VQFNLTEVQAAMEESIESLGGIDAAIEACDRMYCATYRSEVFKLSDCEHEHEEFTSLYLEMAKALYAKATGQTIPEKPTLHWSEIDEHMLDSFGYEMDAYDNAAESWMKDNHPGFIIDGNTSVVEFCNYKGEGEGGLNLFELHKHLPVFISKSHSFNQINQ